MGKIYIKNKTKFRILIIAIALVVVVIGVLIYLTFIWDSSSEKVNIYDDSGNSIKKTDLSNISKYDSYESINDTELVTNKYFDEVRNLVDNLSFDELYSKMDTKFMSDYSLTKESLKKELENSYMIGENPTIYSMTVSKQKNDVFVYRIQYSCYRDFRRYINLIETEPYKYTVSFEQEKIPTVTENKYLIENEGLIFEVIEIYRKENNIAYSVKITNKTDKTVEFRFNSIADMQLDIKDSGAIKQSTSVLSSTKYKIEKDSFFIKKLYFPINMQYHYNIKGMTFFNVMFGDGTKDITIDF